MAARDDFETLAPEFKVALNGSAWPEEAGADLIALSVLEDVDAASMLSITLSCWDTATSRLKWIDDDRFREGNAVEVSLGYRDRTTSLLVGDVTGVEPEFLQSRGPTLTLRGHDRRHRLMRSRRTRSFTQCKDSDIASQLASEAGLSPDVEDSGVTLPYVLQHQQTDLEFLMTRAARIGYRVTVRDRTLSFRAPDLAQAPALTLYREIHLIDFRPRLSTLGQVPGFEVRGWDPAQKQEIVGTASAGDESRLMGGSVSGPQGVQRAFQTAASVRATQPLQNRQEADQLAMRGLRDMALQHIRAEGLCIGDPRLRAGTVVRIEGLGQRFSGDYYIASAEHRFGRGKGYRTAFSALRNAT